jgi:hypothetical protein
MSIHRSRAGITAAVTAAGSAAAFVLAGCAAGAASSAASNSTASNNAASNNAGQASGTGQAARPSRPAGFTWFRAGPAPPGWHSVALPDGGAVLSYPRSLRALPSDRGAVSEGLTTKAGTVLVYLNVTPKQGGETLRGWAAFRVEHLLDDDASAARMTGQATGLKFRGGTGSCVLDSYTTKAHANHYREIACFVQGAHRASVLVAATPEGDWGTYEGLLERAVDAYAVS